METEQYLTSTFVVPERSANSSEEDENEEQTEWNLDLSPFFQRRQQLLDLNARLANHIAQVKQEKQEVRLRDQLPSICRKPPQIQKSTFLNRVTQRNYHDESCEEVKRTNAKLEASLTAQVQNLQNKLNLSNVRIDAMNLVLSNLNEVNENLIEEAAELKRLHAEKVSHLTKLANENEQIRERLREMENLVISLSIKDSFNQHKTQIVQKQNELWKIYHDEGPRLLQNYFGEDASNSASGLRVEVQEYLETLRTKLSAKLEALEDYLYQCISIIQEEFVPKGQLSQAEECLLSVTEELEAVKFDSESNKRTHEKIISRLKQKLRERESLCQRNRRKFEGLLSSMETFYDIDKDIQNEVDTYRRLLEQNESRPTGSETSSSGVFSSPSKDSSPSRTSTCSHSISADISSPEDRVDVLETSVAALRISNHDVRRGKFIVLQNSGAMRLDISDWCLVQECGGEKVSYQFPSTVVIEAQSKLIVWSADAAANHFSPINYVLERTTFPWCTSEDFTLTTTVFNTVGGEVATRQSRIHNSAWKNNSEKTSEEVLIKFDPICGVM